MKVIIEVFPKSVCQQSWYSWRLYNRVRRVHPPSPHTGRRWWDCFVWPEFAADLSFQLQFLVGEKRNPSPAYSGPHIRKLDQAASFYLPQLAWMRRQGQKEHPIEKQMVMSSLRLPYYRWHSVEDHSVECVCHVCNAGDDIELGLVLSDLKIVPGLPVVVRWREWVSI